MTGVFKSQIVLGWPWRWVPGTSNPGQDAGVACPVCGGSQSFNVAEPAAVLGAGIA